MNLVHALEAVPAAELQKLSALFSVIKQVRNQTFNVDQSLLERQFELHVQGILERLEVRLPAFVDPKAKKAEVLMAKYGLYDAVFLQIIAACGAGMTIHRREEKRLALKLLQQCSYFSITICKLFSVSILLYFNNKTI